jgi:hypothetical protein
VNTQTGFSCQLKGASNCSGVATTQLPCSMLRIIFAAASSKTLGFPSPQHFFYSLTQPILAAYFFMHFAFTAFLL